MYEELLSNGLTINALRSFLLVAEKGGYAAAADRDDSKAANLKNRIKGLTDPFHGVPLFQPQGRGVTLTAKGKELQLVATQALQLLEDFRKSCEEERHLIRIGGGQSFFDELFLPQWSRIHERLGKSRFQLQNLRTAEAIRQVKEQRMDFALVRSGASGADGLEFALLAEINFSLCVPRQLLRRGKKGSALTDVRRTLPMATLAGDGNFRRQLDKYARMAGFNFQFLAECGSHSQVCDFVETGTVAAVLPSSMGAAIPNVVSFPMSDSDGFHRAAALVWHPDRARIVPEIERGRVELTRILKKQQDSFPRI